MQRGDISHHLRNMYNAMMQASYILAYVARPDMKGDVLAVQSETAYQLGILNLHNALK